MEANRWYMCKHDYGLGTDIIFKEGKVYFFEPQGNAIATIDEVGNSYYFSDNYRGTFIYLFRLATNEEIYNPNQVVFKEKANVESQVLTKRQQFAMAAMQGILSNHIILEKAAVKAIKEGTTWEFFVGTQSLNLADALLKALNEK